MAVQRTEAYEAGQLALFVDKDIVYNALSERVAKIIEPLYDSGFDFEVCHLHPDGRIEDGNRKFLGYWSEGKVYNQDHKMVGEATGDHALKAAAALLSIRKAQAMAGQDTQAQGMLMRRPPLKRPDHKLQTVIVHPPIGLRPPPEPERHYVRRTESEPMDPWVSLVLWLALIGIVITVIIVALLFVAVTSPIWAGMMLFAVISLRMLIWTHTESLDHDWPDFAKTYKIKQSVYFMALSWGAFSAAIITLVSRDVATPYMCAGAIVIGVLFIHRFLDRWGAKQLFRRQEQPEAESKPWIATTAAFIRARSPIVVSSTGGLFAIAIVLSATVFAKRPSYVASVVETTNPSVSNPAPFSNPASDAPVPDTSSPEPESAGETKTPEPSGKGEADRSGLPSKSADLASLSMFELDCLRNEPYARRGYKFKRDDLRAFFSKQSWYQPKTSDQDGLWKQMSHDERELILRIKSEQGKRNR